MEYANTELLRGVRSCLDKGEAVSLYIASSAPVSSCKGSLIEWPNQLHDMLERHCHCRDVKLNKISHTHDLDKIESLLLSITESRGWDICLCAFSCISFNGLNVKGILARVYGLFQNLKRVGRSCVLITLPPVVSYQGEWSLEFDNQKDLVVLAELREAANAYKIPFIDLYAIWKMGIALHSLDISMVLDPDKGITHYGHAIIADQIWEAFGIRNPGPTEYSWSY